MDKVTKFVDLLYDLGAATHEEDVTFTYNELIDTLKQFLYFYNRSNTTTIKNGGESITWDCQHTTGINADKLKPSCTDPLGNRSDKSKPYYEVDLSDYKKAKEAACKKAQDAFNETTDPFRDMIKDRLDKKWDSPDKPYEIVNFEDFVNLLNDIKNGSR